MNHQIELDKTSKKFRCPDCGAKTYVLYIDTQTNEYLSQEVGKCDRQNHCGRHYPPREYFKDNPDKKPASYEAPLNEPFKLPEPRTIDYFQLETAEKTFDKVYLTNFFKFLAARFGARKAGEALLLYMTGRSKQDNETAIIFWQWDIKQNIRTGKVICYDPVTGKRKKDNGYKPHFVHAKGFNFYQCFFGEHLLSEFPDKKVAIVESEKSAIISSILYPHINWLATGGASGCKWREYDTYKVLEGKIVTMYPDAGLYNAKTGRTCYDEWNERIIRIRDTINCTIDVSQIFEKQPDIDRKSDMDIADVLISDKSVL